MVSRYVILIILNTPLIIIGALNSVVGYKLKRMSKRRFLFGISFWALLMVGLLLVKPIYSYLFSNNLTQTEPLSLFDVMQITGIMFTLIIANKAYGKAALLEKRLNDLHQEISIRLSENKTEEVDK